MNSLIHVSGCSLDEVLTTAVMMEILASLVIVTPIMIWHDCTCASCFDVALCGVVV